MKAGSFAVRIAVCGLALVGAVPVQAAFHLWDIKEIYSNHDGSVQFIELFSSSSGQQFLEGHEIRSNSHIFEFPNNSPAPTNNRHLLLATTSYAALSGVPTANYTIPDQFFDPLGDRINFAGGFSVRQFTSAPTDGVTSLNYTAGGTLSMAVNSPTNFAGATGSLNLPPPASTTGDYNANGVVDAADYTIWRDTLGQSAAPPGSGADGDADGTIDPGDYDFWRSRFGDAVPGAAASAATATSAVPESATIASFAMAFAAIFVRRPKNRCSITNR
jgi:hypothetical protein